MCQILINSNKVCLQPSHAHIAMCYAPEYLKYPIGNIVSEEFYRCEHLGKLFKSSRYQAHEMSTLIQGGKSTSVYFISNLWVFLDNF